MSYYTRYDRFRPGAESLEIIEIYRQSQFKHQQGEYGQYNPNSIHDTNQKVCKYTDIIQITGGFTFRICDSALRPLCLLLVLPASKPYMPCFPAGHNVVFPAKNYRLSDKFLDIQAGEYDSTTVFSASEDCLINRPPIRLLNKKIPDKSPGKNTKLTEKNIYTIFYHF